MDNDSPFDEFKNFIAEVFPNVHTEAMSAIDLGGSTALAKSSKRGFSRDQMVIYIHVVHARLCAPHILEAQACQFFSQQGASIGLGNDRPAAAVFTGETTERTMATIEMSDEGLPVQLVELEVHLTRLLELLSQPGQEPPTPTSAASKVPPLAPIR